MEASPAKTVGEEEAPAKNDLFGVVDSTRNGLKAKAQAKAFSVQAVLDALEEELSVDDLASLVDCSIGDVEAALKGIEPRGFVLQLCKALDSHTRIQGQAAEEVAKKKGATNKLRNMSRKKGRNKKSRNKATDSAHPDALGKDILSWVSSENMTQFALELIAAKAEQKGADVQWTNLSFGIDRDSTMNKGLLTRKHSRGVVDAVLAFIASGNEQKFNTMSVITGTPGIGKSRMLVYVVQRLLKDQKHVMYFDLKSRSAHLFWFQQGDVQAYSATMSTYIANSIFFERQDFHVLVDPSDRDSNFAYPRGAHLVIAASTNSARHYSGFTKHIGTAIFYLSAWTLEELQVALLYLQEEGDAIDLGKRMFYVGGTPRYVFSKLMYNRRKAEITAKAQLLSPQILTKALGVMQGVDDVVAHDGRTPGAFFTFDNEAQDGQEVDYTVRKVKFLSKFAQSMSSKHLRAEIMANPSQPHATGLTYEDLVRFDLEAGFHGVCRTACPTPAAPKEVDDFSVGPCEVVDVAFTNSQFWEKLKTLLTDPPAERTLLVQGPGCNSPVIDFADSSRKLYQATCAWQHSFKYRHVRKILVLAGFLVEQAGGKCALVQLDAEEKKAKALSYYLVKPWAAKGAKFYNKKNVLRLTHTGETDGLTTQEHELQVKLVQTVVDAHIMPYFVRTPK